MRIRNKVDGSTFVAELDIGRMADQHSCHVLVLHDDIGGAAALGPLAASVGCEIVESTPAEWAALMLAGFQLPHERRKRSPLQQLTCLVRAMKPRTSEGKRMERTANNLHEVGLKQNERYRRQGRHSVTSPSATRKRRTSTASSFQRSESLGPHIKQHYVKKTQSSTNPNC